MKKNSIYNILLAALAFCGVLSSCSNEAEEIAATTDDDNLVQFTIGETKSRTHHSYGYNDAVRRFGFFNIEWDGGETVYVYSPEATTAAGKHYAAYTVVLADDGTAKLAYNKDGLRWGSGSAHFYAVTGNIIFSGDNCTETALAWYQPFTGTTLYETANGSTSYFRDKNREELLASSGEVSWNKPVSFTFNSISTTLQMDLYNNSGSDMTLSKTFFLNYEIEVTNGMGLVKWNIAKNQPTGSLTNVQIQTYHLSGSSLGDGNVFTFKAGETLHLLFELGPVQIYSGNPLELTIEKNYQDKKTTIGKNKTVDGRSILYQYGTYNQLTVNLNN